MKLLLIGLLLCISLITEGAKQERFKATDAAVDYVGRVKKSDDGSVSFDWSGVYLRTRFTGTSVSIHAGDTRYDEYNVFVDGEWVNKVDLKSRDTVVTLVSGLANGTHTLLFQKRNEGSEGRTIIYSFLLDKGATLYPVYDKPSKLIEFVGNSITCGYGTESTIIDLPYDVRTQNSWHSYAPIIARYFDADYMLTAHSGQGMVKNWDDTVTMSSVTMLHRFTRLFDEGDEDWNFSMRPSLLCIHLGTNDYSRDPKPSEAEYIGAYKRLIAIAREKYGNIPILCISPLCGEPSRSYVRRMVETSGDLNLYYTNILDEQFLDPDPDLGPSYHPTYQGQRKMAMTLIPIISKIMKWSLPEKVVK